MKNSQTFSLLHLPITVFFLCIAIPFYGQPAFTDVTIECGITPPSNPNIPLKHDGYDITDIMTIGTGAAFIDYNSDEYLDIYLTMRNGRNYMFRNDGPSSNYSFTDVTESLGLSDIDGDGSGVAIADYDNDGDPDIFLGNANVDILFRNENGSSFTDVTASSGISTTDNSRTTTASWGDYDNDGLLDLYLSRHFILPGSTNSSTQDVLYHNEGNGKFVDVSHLFNLPDLMGRGFIGGWSDFDNDGDLDIFCINDCQFAEEVVRTRVFENEGGTDPVNDWIFTQVAADIGIDYCSNPMGLAVGDIDHNGYQDYAVSDIGPIDLWTNDGGFLTNISSSAGVNNQPSGYYSWGINFTDYNLDGWLDLFVAEGTIQYGSDIFPQNNFFYENNGIDGLTFTDKSAILAMNDVEVARTSIFGDFDNDGDPDFLIINYNEDVQMKKNNNDNGYNWLKIKLEGVESNRDGIGSIIKLTSGSMVQYFETRSGSSLGGGDDIVAYFGIADATTVDEIEVTWPSGIIQVLTTIEPNQKITIVEESNLPVELIKFYTEIINKKIKLDWSTSSEINNEKFIIERGGDGMNFKEIGSIQGAGFSYKQMNYQYIDEKPILGVNYYRLKQVDKNGLFTYSEIRKVSLDFSDAILVYPNPVKNSNLNLLVDHQYEVNNIELFDFQNKRMVVEYTQDNNRISLNTSNLFPGVYFIKINMEGKMLIKRIIIQ
jgi:hypothetical protein